MKDTDESGTKANGQASLQNGRTLDQHLEEMVSELLGTGIVLDAKTERTGPSASPDNGHAKPPIAIKRSKEAEIEALLERMIFSAETFAQYSH